MSSIILNSIVTLTLFRTLEFSVFFILMGAFSICQIIFCILDVKPLGFSLVFKIFYIIVAISILSKYELEVLPATGFIISALSLVYFIFSLINNRFINRKIYFKKNRYSVAMILISAVCLIIALFTRNYPTKIWISPAIIIVSVLLANLLSLIPSPRFYYVKN